MSKNVFFELRYNTVTGNLGLISCLNNTGESITNQEKPTSCSGASHASGIINSNLKYKNNFGKGLLYPLTYFTDFKKE